MFEIVFFCILSSISLFTVGQIFNQKIINSTNNEKSASTNLIFGIIIFGFIGLLINFFITKLIHQYYSFFLLFFFFWNIYKNKVISKI